MKLSLLVRPRVRFDLYDPCKLIIELDKDYIERRIAEFKRIAPKSDIEIILRPVPDHKIYLFGIPVLFR